MKCYYACAYYLGYWDSIDWTLLEKKYSYIWIELCLKYKFHGIWTMQLSYDTWYKLIDDVYKFQISNIILRFINSISVRDIAWMYKR